MPTGFARLKNLGAGGALEPVGARVVAPARRDRDLRLLRAPPGENPAGARAARPGGEELPREGAAMGEAFAIHVRGCSFLQPMTAAFPPDICRNRKSRRQSP